MENMQNDEKSSSDWDSSSDDGQPFVKPTLMDMCLSEDEGLDGPMKTKNEIIEEQVEFAPEDYEIPQDAQLMPLGSITSIQSKAIIVTSFTAGNDRVLDFENIVFLSDRSLVGKILETFGPVCKPMYLVAIRPDLEMNCIQTDTHLFCVQGKTAFISTSHLRELKGSDASNRYDEEIAVEEQEFSDDEQEREFKRKKTHQKRNAVPVDLEAFEFNPIKRPKALVERPVQEFVPYEYPPQQFEE